jgi:hypothetical protein
VADDFPLIWINVLAAIKRDDGQAQPHDGTVIRQDRCAGLLF